MSLFFYAIMTTPGERYMPASTSYGRTGRFDDEEEWCRICARTLCECCRRSVVMPCCERLVCEECCIEYVYKCEDCDKIHLDCIICEETQHISKKAYIKMKKSLASN